MNKIIPLFAVLVSLFISACVVDSDTPTPTPEKTGRISSPPRRSCPKPESTSKPTPVPPPPVATELHSISLSPEVVSATWVKKESHARVVALTFTSGSKPVLWKGITLSGQAKIAGSGCDFGTQCSHEAFATRVTSLAIYDGVTQVGYAKAPDPKTGKTHIPNVNVAFPSRVSKSFVVQATLSSSASVAEPFDQIAIGIEALWEPVVLDLSGESILGEVQPDIRNQLSSAPTVVQTIRPSGELAIVDFAHPVSRIVVGGKVAWESVAQYKARAKYEATQIDRLAVSLVTWLGVQADPADFKVIAVASEGFVKSQDVMPSTGLMDADLSTNPITVPKDGDVLFQIWAKVAPVVASSVVSGATKGVCRSGHTPALMVDSDRTTGEWDSNYVGKLNARSTGMTSGERIYAAKGAKHGNPMVVRKSKPIVKMLPLSSTTLANIDQDLIKFQIAADSAGSVAVKHVSVSYDKKGAFGLTNFRLRRGATDMDSATYSVRVYVPGSTDLVDELKGSYSGGGTLIVSFHKEEIVSGSGEVYTIHASVTGVKTGDALVLDIHLSADAAYKQSFTGKLTNLGGYFGLKTDDKGEAHKHYTTFLWSDLSEVPHDDTIDGSSDWINDTFVDLTGSVTLKL